MPVLAMALQPEVSSPPGSQVSKRIQTDRQTPIETDIATYRLNQPRGQCNENMTKPENTQSKTVVYLILKLVSFG